jgi:hypothetical protein
MASSERSWAMNHLEILKMRLRSSRNDWTYPGDSGSHETVQNSIMLKTNWKGKGKRHDTGPLANERP